MDETAEQPIALEPEVEVFIRERIKREVPPTVLEAVRQEEEKRFRQLRWFVALVGLVGFGTFGTLSNYLIEKAVDSKIEARTGQISDSLDFVRFTRTSLKLELGRSFTVEDKNAVMGYLRRAAKNERVRHTTEFLAALTQVTQAFVSAGQSASIDEIFLLFEQETLGSQALVESLLHHYGQIIVARVVDPEDDPTMAKFEKLERIAEGAKIPEVPLAYRVLFICRRQPHATQPSVVDLLDQTTMLAKPDRSNFFFQILQRTKTENWSAPSREGKVFERVTREFLNTYAEPISRRFDIEQSVLVLASQDGVEESEARGIAAAAADVREP